MTERTMLQADEAQMRQFTDVIFKHCEGVTGWIAMRAFEHEREGRAVANQWVPFGPGMVEPMVKAATQVANRTGERRAVFSPPVAIFGDGVNKDGNRFAGETNVIAAPAINVELDKEPEASLGRLIQVLGEPTIIIASGGFWKGEPKLHAYWRLGEPATTENAKAALKTARKMATKLVDGDGTAVALSHPMRMPGSWHTKDEPNLCKIIGGDPNRDIKLQWAVEALDEALMAAGLEIDGRGSLARAERKGFKTEREWSAEDLMAAAKAIPNDERTDWEAWNKTGMAFYDASHGSPEGLEAFVLWSEKNPKGDAGDAERRWKHFATSPPDDISAGTLVKLAREAAPDFLPNRLKPEEWFDQAEASDPKNDTPIPSEISLNALKEVKAKAAKFVFEPFYAAASSALTASAAPLIKGLLDQGAMSVVYGQSNVGKTFLTVYIGYHIATGLSYAGMKTTRGHVVYLSAEGGRSITKRLSALCMKYGTEADVDFHLLRSSIDLRRPDADLVPLIYAIKSLGVPVSLIVVDTLSRALAGGDENSSVDMGQIVTNFDKLREHTNAHLMVVHHSGKNQAAGARGHSLLRAATDTEIEVSEGVIAAKKQRDLDKNWSSSFTLDVHTLGVDADGDPVTSCSVRLISHAEATAVQVEALTSSEGVVAAAVAELDAFNEDENEGVGASELIDFLAGKLEDISQNSVRQLLKRGVQKGALTKCRRGRWKTAILQSGQESGQSVFS